VLDSRPVTLLVAGAVGAAFVVGLLVEGVGGALILLGVTAVLAAVTAAAWHHVAERRRPLRLAVLALVAVITAVKLVRALA
jgi:hypothetical protein